MTLLIFKTAMRTFATTAMTQAQLRWLATYDRETGSLSTYAARECGYGDLLLAGLVVNRGPIEEADPKECALISQERK